MLPVVLFLIILNQPSTSAKPQNKRRDKPSGTSASFVQGITGPSLSKGKKRPQISRTSSAASFIPPQPFKPKKRVLSNDQSSQESSAQDEVRVTKRVRTRAQKVRTISAFNAVRFDERPYRLSYTQMIQNNHHPFSTWPLILVTLKREKLSHRFKRSAMASSGADYA